MSRRIRSQHFFVSFWPVWLHAIYGLYEGLYLACQNTACFWHIVLRPNGVHARNGPTYRLFTACSAPLTLRAAWATCQKWSYLQAVFHPVSPSGLTLRLVLFNVKFKCILFLCHHPAGCSFQMRSSRPVKITVLWDWLSFWHTYFSDRHIQVTDEL